MIANNVELIQRILSGDDEAFRVLVQKHQKRVHALIWRKIGDFHIAEEITQDTFLRVYKKLASLKDPNLFDGWLYVIANRLCLNWIRRHKPKTQLQSLEETQVNEVEKTSYANYESDRRETANAEHRREIVKELLEKLPESERTVVTLYYLGEMTAKEIGKFLGVSVNTIKSRLHRARERLQSEEELLINETLGALQLPASITENVMRQVADIQPGPSSVGKPLLPWAAFGTAAVLVLLLLGVGSQYLARFQKPYNVDAHSETTVEIIDATIVLDTQAKPDLRNQAGRFDNTGKHIGSGPQAAKPVVLAAAQVEKETHLSTEQQWVQANGPEGVNISGLFRSASGEVYATSRVGIYRLTPNTSAWTLVNTTVVMRGMKGINPMAERGETLYLATSREVYTSTDSGENWKLLGERPKGTAMGLVITDDGLYLALENQIFRSTDAGKQWTPLQDEETGRMNLAIAAIENTVFIGTTGGLYRVRAGTSEKLPVDTTKAIHSLAVSGRNLYVGTGPDISELTNPEGRAAYTEQLMQSSWDIFHSPDLGDSWTKITPTGGSFWMKVSPGVKVLADGETLLVLGFMTNFRSTDAGKTWTELSFDFDADTFDLNALMNSAMMSMFPALTVDESTFFKAGAFGLTRSTDGGTSWHPFMKGMVGTTIFNLVAFKNAMYTGTATGVVTSIDGGESWQPVRVHAGELTLQPAEKSKLDNLLMFPRLLISDGLLYGVTPDLQERNKLRVHRLSAGGNVLVPIQGIPAFPEDVDPEAPETETSIAPKTDSAKDQENPIARQMEAEDQQDLFSDGFAVSGDTFYVEYKQRLFRWQRGDPEWTNTGLIDVTQTFDLLNSQFKIAALAETVYVGKQDGHLLRSFDGGNTWKDLTPHLPLRFKRINEIVFADSIVYVATDTGVLTSADGEHWRAITNQEGTHVAIDRIAVAAPAIYGAGDTGVYQLDNRDRWERISPEVPDDVIALVVNNNKLYIATEMRGMFHISLENEKEK